VDKIIDDILGGIVMAIANIYMWHKLHNQKISFKNYKVYVSIIFISIICIFNYYFVNNYIKILTILVASFIGNCFLFKRKDTSNIFVPIISELIILLSELMISIVAFTILNLDMNFVSSNYFGSLIINILIGFMSVILVNISFFKKLLNFLQKITSNIPKNIIISIFALLIIICNFLLAISYYKIETKYVLIFDTVMIIIYSFIVFKMLEQKNRYIKISNKYNMTNTTLKELEQNVTRLKITNHENKNQLLTIRNMIKKGEDGKSLIKHIENIVNTKIKDDETLMLQTSTITNSMISSIVYSKMLTMKENDVDAALIISRDIKDLYLSDIPDELAVEVCKIIGVYLDNALEEVSKYEEKIINMEFYAEKKTLCIAISNNFEGEIDFEKMDNPGYTTKENGHGYGLSLAHEIIESNDRLSSEREIKDNIFKQILKIKM
jgi:two-component system sensor histidine kinase AgrC